MGGYRHFLGGYRPFEGKDVPKTIEFWITSPYMVIAPPQDWNSQFCFWSQRIYNGGRICYISYVYMVLY